MSKIGKINISIPEKVKVILSGNMYLQLELIIDVVSIRKIKELLSSSNDYF